MSILNFLVEIMMYFCFDLFCFTIQIIVFVRCFNSFLETEVIDLIWSKTPTKKTNLPKHTIPHHQGKVFRVNATLLYTLFI